MRVIGESEMMQEFLAAGELDEVSELSAAKTMTFIFESTSRLPYLTSAKNERPAKPINKKMKGSAVGKSSNQNIFLPKWPISVFTFVTVSAVRGRLERLIPQD